jgi:hypothetical protein
LGADGASKPSTGSSSGGGGGGSHDYTKTPPASALPLEGEKTSWLPASVGVARRWSGQAQLSRVAELVALVRKLLSSGEPWRRAIDEAVHSSMATLLTVVTQLEADPSRIEDNGCIT